MKMLWIFPVGVTLTMVVILALAGFTVPQARWLYWGGAGLCLCIGAAGFIFLG
jgi:hypothetical protein